MVRKRINENAVWEESLQLAVLIVAANAILYIIYILHQWIKNLT